MATINVTIHFADAELDSAIRFVGAKSDEVVEAVKQDFFSKDLVLDLNQVKEDQKRYYHSNGLVAMLISIADQIAEDNA